MRLRLAAPREGRPDAVPPPWEGGKGSAGMSNVSCVHALEVDETPGGPLSRRKRTSTMVFMSRPLVLVREMMTNKMEVRQEKPQ